MVLGYCVWRDAGTDDAAALPDGSAGDREVEDAGAVTDAGAVDVGAADHGIIDAATRADSGFPATAHLTLQIDEPGTDTVGGVSVTFVLMDWSAFAERPVCVDGGVEDAAGVDSGFQLLSSFRTETVGQQAHLNLVGRESQSLRIGLPEIPPDDHLDHSTDDPCGLLHSGRVAYYLPFAYLDGPISLAGEFDNGDDIIGMAQPIRFQGQDLVGQPFLVYTEPSEPPGWLLPGWSFMLSGSGGVPLPEVSALADRIFPVTITATPRDSMTVQGQLYNPIGTLVGEPGRRTALVVQRTLGGIDEIVSDSAEHDTFELSLPARLGGGDLSDFLFPWGTLRFASGYLYVYGDDDGSGSLTQADTHQGTSVQSCPSYDFVYHQSPLPWPFALLYQAKTARGYNLYGRTWDAETEQIEALPLRISPVLQVSVPNDQAARFVDSEAPTPDTGCACGLIPLPHGQCPD